MILGLEPQVHAIASSIARRVPRTVAKDDLISEGWLGAVKAVDGFDANRGVTLRTYAEQKIRGVMLDHLRALDRTTTRRERRRCRATGEIPKRVRFVSVDAITAHPRVEVADLLIRCELAGIIRRANLTAGETTVVRELLRGEFTRRNWLKYSAIQKMRQAAA